MFNIKSYRNLSKTKANVLREDAIQAIRHLLDTSNQFEVMLLEILFYYHAEVIG